MKLWFFRTPGNRWGYCEFPLDDLCMQTIDGGGSVSCKLTFATAMYFTRRPRWWKRDGFPPLKPGECVPVELTVAAKKKARKE